MGANNLTVQGTITSSAVAVLTCPAPSNTGFIDGYYYKIQSINFTNDGGAAEVVDAYVVKSGDSATDGAAGNKVTVDLAIASNESFVAEPGDLHALKPGDSYQLKADTGGIVNYNLTYTIELEKNI